MNTLIVKLDATGDVVRTTPLLRRLTGHITWLTETRNRLLLEGLTNDLQCISWDERQQLPDLKYDLIINLEDDLAIARHLKTLKFEQLFGAYADSDGKPRYTADSRGWFDLSLISSYGKEQADKLKFQNRRTYQDLIFDGFGLGFRGRKSEVGIISFALATASGCVR